MPGYHSPSHICPPINYSYYYTGILDAGLVAVECFSNKERAIS